MACKQDRSSTIPWNVCELDLCRVDSTPFFCVQDGVLSLPFPIFASVHFVCGCTGVCCTTVAPLVAPVVSGHVFWRHLPLSHRPAPAWHGNLLPSCALSYLSLVRATRSWSLPWDMESPRWHPPAIDDQVWNIRPGASPTTLGFRPTLFDHRFEPEVFPFRLPFRSFST